MANPRHSVQKLADLRALSDEELVERHDEMADPNIYPGAFYYYDELMRRQADEREAAMLRMTRQMRALTVLAAVFAAASVVVALFG